jgi:hypothetical protein
VSAQFVSKNTCTQGNPPQVLLCLQKLRLGPRAEAQHLQVEIQFHLQTGHTWLQQMDTWGRITGARSTGLCVIWGGALRQFFVGPGPLQTATGVQLLLSSCAHIDQTSQQSTHPELLLPLASGACSAHLPSRAPAVVRSPGGPRGTWSASTVMTVPSVSLMLTAGGVPSRVPVMTTPLTVA